MPTKKDVMDALQRWTQLLEQHSELASQFAGYKKTFLITLPDLKFSVQMVFEGTNRAHLVEAAIPNPDMSLTVDSKLFVGICNGETDPMEAFMSGKLKPKGNMADLQRLEVFLDLLSE